MSWVLPQALGYYGDSVAIGVTTRRRSHGCNDWFGPHLGSPFVRCPPHWGAVWPGSSAAAYTSVADGQIPGFSIFPERFDRPRRDWGSSSIALPMCGLADGRLGVDAIPYPPFTRHAIVPSTLSGEGVRESRGSSRKAVPYPHSSSGASRCWRNQSCLA
jgi:hypothetical protein